MDTICYLKITSWAGMSIGAVHYYGNLHCGDYANDVKMENILTRQDAIAYNKVERSIGRATPYVYRQGQKTTGFLDRDRIIELAIQTYKQHFPQAIMLILANAARYEPQIVLDAVDTEFKEIINAMHAEGERFGWHEGNPKRMNALDKRFDDFMKKWNRKQIKKVR